MLMVPGGYYRQIILVYVFAEPPYRTIQPNEILCVINKQCFTAESQPVTEEHANIRCMCSAESEGFTASRHRQSQIS